jgi:hypothetical protein
MTGRQLQSRLGRGQPLLGAGEQLEGASASVAVRLHMEREAEMARQGLPPRWAR